MAHAVVSVPTKAFADQKPGTSGLRKAVRVFEKDHYLENFIESIFQSVPATELQGSTLVASGDGRYYSEAAIQTIVKMSAAHGVRRLWIGENGMISTPAVSAIVRERDGGVAYGAIILTASHNPGGPDADFGVKFNTSNGGPAPEKVTNAIYDISKTISHFSTVPSLPTIDLTKVHKESFQIEKFGEFTVEVISSTEDYIHLLNQIFDFDMIRKLTERKDFHMNFDAMFGVAGVYAMPVFHELLHIAPKDLHNATPKPDFNHWHPDPNLTYCKELVPLMGLTRKGTALPLVEGAASPPAFGAACDGDADRAMIMGSRFFVSPSDSLAVVAANAHLCIPYFRGGLKAIARSMPTSAAVDLVGNQLGVPVFETPTGWKFFGNLMDSVQMGGPVYNPVICGEESFGLGSDHVREKDGVWAVLCWLSIMAHNNPDPSKPLVSIHDILLSHWKIYGRHYYTRYDYEGVESSSADAMMSHLQSIISTFNVQLGSLEIVKIDDFCYNDPIDHSVSAHQGIRLLFRDNSRVIFRLSGTGSVGATIRVYLEKYEKDPTRLELPTEEVMKELVDAALSFSKIESLTGRKEPTVIT